MTLTVDENYVDLNTDNDKEMKAASTSTSSKMRIRRLDINQKKRPNGWRRQDSSDLDVLRQMDSIFYLHETDLEWLCLNWRKYRAQKMSRSIRRMILIMFEVDYQYFPTLNEIKDSLIKYQMIDLTMDKKSWNKRTSFKHLR